MYTRISCLSLHPIPGTSPCTLQLDDVLGIAVLTVKLGSACVDGVCIPSRQWPGTGPL